MRLNETDGKMLRGKAVRMWGFGEPGALRVYAMMYEEVGAWNWRRATVWDAGRSTW